MAKALSDTALLMRLRTRQLLLLEALGRERNLGRAAAALGMSQPAATKLLQQVEEAVGAQLFTRQARGMEPTGAGEVLIRFARQSLVDFGFAREQMAALRSGLHGRLRLGSVPGALPELLAPALAAYKKQHPRVAVSVLVETSDVMLELLARGDVDLVLGRPTEGHYGDEFEIRPLLGEPQVAVVRAGHPLLKKRKPALEDLVHWPWILQPPGSPQRSRFESALRVAGLHARLDITETASTVATTVLLEASDMAAIMPASLAAHYARLGVLQVVPLQLPLQVPPLHLVTRKHRELTPAAAGFVEVLVGR
ncbi:LysR family transcriptional regulator [Ramlibacter sp. USB13]|uniref:LysR family transcriptional regulator n=1 Tax=Ramlibacter cellulosilyticus TaxID=2764187 RepID=A0A923MRZ1_9BURK|nr:LysR family transcriptional regulator [Ramlibacter cellulosilyticus]MBC5783876.1 LysR family transcriptional regulator [Ramlibacter cellulosilyticus]